MNDEHMLNSAKAAVEAYKAKFRLAASTSIQMGNKEWNQLYVRSHSSAIVNAEKKRLHGSPHLSTTLAELCCVDWRHHSVKIKVKVVDLYIL